MNYQEKSDHEISCEVGRRLGLVDYLMVVHCQRDYCNSWAHAGPIIQENGINLFASKVIGSASLKEWEAMSFDGTCHHWGELNPLRAAMIVFLMMKGGE